ncbi:MAG TPA: Ger(x)C family spore germination protein [Symbiobacteriaceae bacterium]|nr:Ger(x)C family spore germination protein [Symbiobacteriaceae bacterium]
MRRKLMALCLAAALLLSGCWDKLDIEDQLFPVAIGLDKGERRRFRMVVRVPIAAQIGAGILGGSTGTHAETSEFLSVEADSVAQGMLMLNTSAARRITMRHLRSIIVGEELAREGIHVLMAELSRNPELRETAAFLVARGSAVRVLSEAKPTGEVNPGKIAEGVLLVERALHMAPPIRLHHMLARQTPIGVDAYAAMIGLNRQIMEGELPETEGSAYAGDIDRMGKNPMEVAGTAIFRQERLAGFLTVDETQAFLALRGEMGKAYITIPDFRDPSRTLLIRFQQENKPKYQASLTESGPRVTGRLIFEGEVLSGDIDFRDIRVRRKLEAAADTFINDALAGVLKKLEAWEADPIGFGLLFRSRFPTWADWERFSWPDQIKRLKATVTGEMRIRRFGLIHSGPYIQRRER